jgi:hypothetical protein
LHISPMWTPIIAVEVRKLELRPASVCGKIVFFMLVPYREFISPVMTSVLIIL